MVEMGIFLYFGGLIMLSLNLNFILSMLISLEYMMLSLFLMMVVLLSSKYIEFIVFYMVLSVCEASLGLGLLIIGMMAGGSKMYKSFDLMMW